MNMPVKEPSSAKPPRRTQAERSEAMRARLIDATLVCLARDGYVGTTVSNIINEAQVSRGAPLHHFPSKAALIDAAAEQLIRNLYTQLGVAISSLADSENRLADMIMASWQELFGSNDSAALLELTLASRRDAELAGIMQRLGSAGYEALNNATQHYFEPVQPPAASPERDLTHYFVLTYWLMRGMAIEQHLLNDPEMQQHFLRLWAELLGLRMRPRAGISVPPPKPSFWQRT